MVGRGAGARIAAVEAGGRSRLRGNCCVHEHRGPEIDELLRGARATAMTTLRPFTCDDLFTYNDVNTDVLTETFHLNF